MANIRIPLLNEVTLAGRLVRDPEMKYTQTGKAVAQTAIAVGIKDNTRFHGIKGWEKSADVLVTCRKGDPVVVRGYLDVETWEKDGQKREKTVVVCHSISPLLWPEDDAHGTQGTQSNPGGYVPESAPAPRKPGTAPGFTEPATDDIPF